MFDEENCIYNIDQKICKKNIDKIQNKDYENLEHFCCGVCNDKIILEEGKEIKVKEIDEYILKRKNGKLIKIYENV